jgi:hypothetical protein
MKYYFRGLLILKYDIQWKDLKVTEDFNKCKFIAEDYLLIAEFMDKIYKLQTGIPVAEGELKDIEVY